MTGLVVSMDAFRSLVTVVVCAPAKLFAIHLKTEELRDYLNDAREGDEEEVTDYERAGGPYPELAARSTERCMIDIKVQSISAATVHTLLGKP